MNFAKMESMMFRRLEIKSEQKHLKEEAKALDDQLFSMLQESGLDEYIAKFNDTHNLKISIENKTKKLFDKEQFADDLGADSVSEAQKKEFLIDATEQGRLTLETFKKYFFEEPETKITIKKVKIPKRQR